jgi:hypothetical protein
LLFTNRQSIVLKSPKSPRKTLGEEHSGKESILHACSVVKPLPPV